MTDSEQEEPRGELVIRTLAMPADTNPAGDIFGGWLLAQMDIAGGVLARARDSVERKLAHLTRPGWREAFSGAVTTNAAILAES